MRQRLIEECELLLARVGLEEPSTYLGANVLGRDHRAQLVERQAEQVAQPCHLPQPLDIQL